MTEPSPAKSSAPLKVLIVDDHYIVRSGLTAALELDDGIVVAGEVDRGDTAVAAYRKVRPDVVLMDLQLPGLGGVAATRDLIEHDPASRILIYSTFARDNEIQAALGAGALGYLQKTASRDELLTALRQVAKGEQHVAPALARPLAEMQQGPSITPREREVLALIAAGRANKEIGAAFGISEDTVKRHVSHILAKLEVSDRAEATAEAIRRGIVQMRE